MSRDSCTGRVIRADKRASIDARLPPILERLNIAPEAWSAAMRPKCDVFGRALGRLDHRRLHASTLGLSWVCGLREVERLYAS